MSIVLRYVALHEDGDNIMTNSTLGVLSLTKFKLT